ncbi:HalD/BesD family halogenase [Sneathiella glossodoripedis]|uniref:HalD/BesD family halogenase n=1 Tax=Sneathiella glossodoripedis TaxID=418853 RepID=UPI000472011B|nr:2OG-Fe(II) oxygenase [Sneathiella glossodoripedis]
MKLEQIINHRDYPISDPQFIDRQKQALDKNGIIVLENFISPRAVETIRTEGLSNEDLVYAKTERHTVYLSPTDKTFPDQHIRNQLVISSKGCLTDDQIGESSPLKILYRSTDFKNFLCSVLREENLYPYADPLSSVNLHFAKTGQELGWHYDNSSFAITLMIQPADQGGEFEFVKNTRSAENNDMGYETTEKVLNGDLSTEKLSLGAGTLVLFRGRNSLHRVRPNLGERTRMLAVLAYNSEPGISLSEEARKTFYGRIN